MIKILKSKKYDKMQYDKLFDFFYHMALSKYDKKKTYASRAFCGYKNTYIGAPLPYAIKTVQFCAP